MFTNFWSHFFVAFNQMVLFILFCNNSMTILYLACLMSGLEKSLDEMKIFTATKNNYPFINSSVNYFPN